MAIIVTKREAKYEELANTLRKELGNERSYRWLADRMFVSQESVHYWMTGQCRPRPDRLGQLAALFGLDPENLIDLAFYHDDPIARDKVLAAHAVWRLVV